jgi:hypothetical protein
MRNRCAVAVGPEELLMSSYFWSSTTYAYYTDYAWRVNFYYGNDYYSNKSFSYYVRAVRGGQ